MAFKPCSFLMVYIFYTFFSRLIMRQLIICSSPPPHRGLYNGGFKPCLLVRNCCPVADGAADCGWRGSSAVQQCRDRGEGPPTLTSALQCERFGSVMCSNRRKRLGCKLSSTQAAPFPAIPTDAMGHADSTLRASVAWLLFIFLPFVYRSKV